MRKALNLFVILFLASCSGGSLGSTSTEQSSHIEVKHEGRNIRIYPVNGLSPNIGGSDFDAQVDIFGNQIAVYVQPSPESGLYQDFLILDFDDLASEQKLVLQNDLHISRFENVEFDPGLYNELDITTTSITLEELLDQAGPYDYVFFAEMGALDHANPLPGGRLHFYESPFPGVRYIWIESSLATSGTGKVASEINSPASTMFSTLATYMPWQTIAQLIKHTHFHPQLKGPISEWMHEFIFSRQPAVVTELQIAVQTPVMMLAPGEPRSFEGLSPPEALVVERDLDGSENEEELTDSHSPEDELLRGSIAYIRSNPPSTPKIENFIETRDLKTGDTRTIWASDKSIDALAVSPDRSTLAFIEDHHSVSMIGVDGGNYRLIINGDNYPWEAISAIAWSPDGESIVVLSWRYRWESQSYFIYQFNILDQTHQYLTEFPYFEHPGRLSWANGGIIMGGRVPSTSHDRTVQELVRISGSQPYDVITNLWDGKETSVSFDPEWSPDGTMIAFRYSDNHEAYHNTQIWLIDSDGTSNLRKISDGDSDAWPTWSPEGKRILFSRLEISYIDEQYYPVINSSDLWVVGLESELLVPITETPNVIESYPVWLGALRAETEGSAADAEGHADDALLIITPEDIVPAGYKPRASVTYDLNHDGLPEVAISSDIQTDYTFNQVVLTVAAYNQSKDEWEIVYERLSPDGEDWILQDLKVVEDAKGLVRRLLWQIGINGTAGRYPGIYFLGWDGASVYSVFEGWGFGDPEITDSGFIIRIPQYKEEDPDCCPSSCTLRSFQWADSSVYLFRDLEDESCDR